MHGRIADRRRYPVPVCRFEPDLSLWSMQALGSSVADLVDTACALGRISAVVSSAPRADLVRLEHAAVWSLGVGPSRPAADPLQDRAIAMAIVHPAAPLLTPGRPSMGVLVQAHRSLWAGQRQAGKPRSAELPSPALPRDADGTPCLAPSPRDVLRLGASIDRTVSELPVSMDQVLLGSAWMLWAIESTAPLPDGNEELAWSSIAAWMCSSAGMHHCVLDLHASLDADVHRQRRHDLAVNGSIASWSAHVWRTVTRACNATNDRLLSLANARKNLLARADAMRAPRHPRELVMHLMGSPITDVRQVERTLGITFAAANDLVERCTAAGILREVTGRRRGRIYCCDASAKALEACPGSEGVQPNPKSLRTMPTTPASAPSPFEACATSSGD